MVSEAEKYKAEDEAEAERIAAKNGLESYGESQQKQRGGKSESHPDFDSGSPLPRSFVSVALVHDTDSNYII